LNTPLVNELLYSTAAPLTVFNKGSSPARSLIRLGDDHQQQHSLSHVLVTVIEAARVGLVCPHCADSYRLTSTEQQQLDQQSVLEDDGDMFLYAPGCDRCDHTGSEENSILLSATNNSDQLRNAVQCDSLPTIENALQSEDSILAQSEALARGGKISFHEYQRIAEVSSI